MCLAEGLGYSADSAEFLSLQELKLPYVGIYRRPQAVEWAKRSQVTQARNESSD